MALPYVLYARGGRGEGAERVTEAPCHSSTETDRKFYIKTITTLTIIIAHTVHLL